MLRNFWEVNPELNTLNKRREINLISAELDNNKFKMAVKNVHNHADKESLYFSIGPQITLSVFERTVPQRMGGVNLPSNAVIIKGAQVYNVELSSFVDLDILDVSQVSFYIYRV